MRRSLEDRFHDKYIRLPIAGCWLWTAATKDSGHGVMGRGSRKDRLIAAHRVSYLIHKGQIDPRLNVLHRCGVASCVNPDHLYQGTQVDNARDMISHGRHFIPDNRGTNAVWAKLTEEQAKEIYAAKATKIKGTGTFLAKKFNVSRSTVYEIWRGKNWAHLK